MSTDTLTGPLTVRNLSTHLFGTAQVDKAAIWTLTVRRLWVTVGILSMDHFFTFALFLSALWDIEGIFHVTQVRVANAVALRLRLVCSIKCTKKSPGTFLHWRPRTIGKGPQHLINRPSY